LAVIVVITAISVFFGGIIGFPVGIVISALIIVMIEEQLKILNGL
jgi:hypothetical protein